MGFKPDVMKAAAGGFALATDLAEYLVARQVPFREAHEAIGTLVRETAAAGRTLEALTLEDLRRYSAAFGADAIGLLSAESSLRARKLIGGPAPATVRKRLKQLDRS
jgi:argininosuccinate lyase